MEIFLGPVLEWILSIQSTNKSLPSILTQDKAKFNFYIKDPISLALPHKKLHSGFIT